MTPIGIRLSLNGEREVETGLRRVSGAMDTVGDSASVLQRAVGGLGAAFAGAISVREFVQAADAVTGLQNQLKLATGGAQQAAAAYTALYDIAQRSRTGFIELGTTFASISTAAADLGVSQQRLLTVTEAIGNAVTISGTGAQAAQAALVQLGQGLASGTLRGEELNSVMEQTPRLAKALADGLGISRGELRALGAQGEITAEQVIKALESQAGALRTEVEGAVMTVGQAFTNLKNSSVRAVGDIDAATGATALFAGAIGDVTAGIDALRENTGVFEILRTAGETLRVLYNDIAFVFAAMGRELGGIAAQAAAIARLDFRGAGVIRQELIADGVAARARLDAAQGNILKRPEVSGEVVDTSAEDARLARMTREKRDQIKADKEIAEITRELSGVNKDYLPTLTKLHKQYEDGRLTLTEYQRLVGELAKKNYKKDDGAAKALKEEQNAYEGLITSIRVKIAQEKAELNGAARLAESDRIRIKMVEELATGKLKLTAADKARVNAAIDELAVLERQQRLLATERVYMEQRAEIQAEVNAAYVEESRLREAGRQGVIDYVKGIEESNQALEFELSLMGLSQQSRETALEQYRIELDLKRRIREVNTNSGFNQDQRNEEIAKLTAAAAIAKANASSKVFLQEWQQSVKQYDDIFRQGFADMLNNGQAGWKSFTRSLVTTFKTTVADQIYKMFLQPFVVRVVGQFMGMSGGGGMLGALGGGGGGVGDMVSGASSLIRNGLNVAGMGGNSLMGLADMAYKYGLENVGQMVDSFRYGMMDASTWSGFQGAFEAGGAQFAGAIAGSVLNGFSGYGISKLISNGYQVNPWMDRIGGIASAIPGIGPIAGVITGAINRLFGRKLKDMGIEGEFGGESGFEGRTYQFYKGGLFRSNKTKYGELDEELRAALGDQFNTMRVGTAAMAEVLGLGTDAIDNFTASIKVSFNGLDEAGIQKALKEELDKVAETLASATLGTTEYTRAGESSVEALTRLSGSLTAVNSVFENLGVTLYQSSLAGADMASSLVDLFGGADKFGAAAGTYFQNFYSQDEQREAMRRQLEKQLGTLNVKLPDIDATDARAQYRALVNAALEDQSEQGRKLAAMLLQLAGSFAAITPAAEDADERIRRVAEQRATLDERMLAAQGNDRGVLDLRRKQEYDALYKLDPALAKLVAQIYALEDASAIAAKKLDLDQRLLVAQGDDRGALDLRRKQEYDALYKLDPELAKLIAKIYALEDAAAIASKQFDVEQRLLIAQGRTREALDLRRKQEYDALYKLDPALAKMIAKVWELEDAAQAVADAQTARGNAMRDLADAMGRQREIWEGQLEAIDTQRQVQQEALGLITGIFELVRSNARELYGEVQSTAAMQAAQGNAFIAQALATAQRTGYLPEQEALQQAITGARAGLGATQYSSQVDADFARLVLAGQLKALEEIAGPQKTAAQQQLDALDSQTDAINKLIKDQQKEYDLIQRQVDIANGTYNAAITVAQALANIYALLSGNTPGTATSGTGATGTSGDQPVFGGTATSKGTGTTPYVPPAYVAPTGGTAWGGSMGPGSANPLQVLRIDDDGRAYYSDGSVGPARDGWVDANGNWVWAKNNPNHGRRTPSPAFAFANGGAFTNGIVTRPTAFSMAQMGEAGPEAVMPLANVGGRLGVYAMGAGNSSAMAEVVAELRAVKAELAAVRASTAASAESTGQLAEQTDSVTEGGNANRVEIMNVKALAKALAEELAA
ncbi:tape measure protein [Acidovorax sp. Leaf160]|uniref:tape measure protein n=1 Tax=Acidovorax sp. Leaf160 TaxID=1736280 RepID=UPI0006F56366|nr:tape measure protein [Acidovorax sp. Leaf160]KQR55631.1 hypothetical protein ASF94_04295 [Acidovorax sp. Leaf160]